MLYAERADATVYHPTVCLSVTFRYRDHIGWNTLQIILPPNSLRSLLTSTYHFLQSADKDHATRNACCGRKSARCRCKIRYVSKLTAASRGPPCDSTESCLHCNGRHNVNKMPCYRREDRAMHDDE